MYILNCDAFDSEQSARHSNKCCSGPGSCHETKAFINVTPYAADATLENRKLDWSLGIQGYVCCGRYEFVRSLSREWWIRKLAIVHNWTEEMVKSHLTQGSWHAVYDKRPSPKQTSQVAKVKAPTCPQCGSKWNQVACNDCGYSE